MSGIPKADGSKIDLTKPGIYLCRVTRELALKWLDRNFANRPVRREHVRVIAAMILRGEWRDDHPGVILFGLDGNLLDGQHRLHAIAEAGIPVMVRVECGVKPEVREYIDTGKSRTLYDRKTFDADHHVNKGIASILRTARMLQTGSSSPLSPTEADEMFGKMPDSYLWAAKLLQKRRDGLTRTGVLYAMAHAHHRVPATAALFWASYIVADGAVQPARMLRDWMLRSPMGTTNPEDDSERTVTCVVASFDGRELQSIRRTATFPAHVKE